MKIVVAPDSFKGCLSAREAAQALARGLQTVWPYADVVCVPVADGGEGTVQTLVDATGGELRAATVTGPLGVPVEASFGLLGDGATAAIEMAAASGFALVPEDRRDPRITTTRGTGELIRAALDAGCRRLICGIGGSATNDGGAGMARALGVRFLDAAGAELLEGGAALAALAAIDASALDSRIADAMTVVACDVDNPLCGERGASAVYGPQKGATPAMVAQLDDALRRYAEVICRDLSTDVADVPGAGAAGGLGAGMLAFLRAELRPGVDIVLDTVHMRDRLRGAAFVIVGEGRIDRSTVHGKAPVGVAKLAQSLGVPVIGVAGSLGDGADQCLDHGIAALVPIIPQPMDLAAALRSAERLLEETGARIARLLQLGQLLR